MLEMEKQIYVVISLSKIQTFLLLLARRLRKRRKERL